MIRAHSPVSPVPLPLPVPVSAPLIKPHPPVSAPLIQPHPPVPPVSAPLIKSNPPVTSPLRQIPPTRPAPVIHPAVHNLAHHPKPVIPPIIHSPAKRLPPISPIAHKLPPVPPKFPATPSTLPQFSAQLLSPENYIMPFTPAPRHHPSPAKLIHKPAPLKASPIVIPNHKNVHHVSTPNHASAVFHPPVPIAPIAPIAPPIPRHPTVPAVSTQLHLPVPAHHPKTSQCQPIAGSGSYTCISFGAPSR